MSHSKSHRVASHVFTLVEIMVAMALLLMMMSFLFEFVLSGQRLWSASEHKLNSYDDGQIVLDLIGEDLRDLVYDNEVGKSRPFYARKGFHTLTVKKNDGTTGTATVHADVYMFFTRFRASQDSTYHLGVYPVCYVYMPYDQNTGTDEAPWAGRLYRVPIEPVSTQVWDAYNEDFTALSTLPACFPVTSLGDDLNEDNVLMQNVRRFSVTPMCSGSASFTGVGFLNSAATLQSVHVSMSIFSKDAINPEEWEEATSLSDKEKLMDLHERSFTKTVRVW